MTEELKKTGHDLPGRQDYSQEENAVIDKYLEKSKDSPPHFDSTIEDGVWKLFPGPLDDKQLLIQGAKLAEATGANDFTLSEHRLSQAVRTYFKVDATNVSRYVNVAAASLYGIKPEDEIEGMLAVQMIGAHNLAVEFLRRAMLDGQSTEGVTENVNRATKLLRTYTTQMETLSRYRNKGQQKVTVEHVQVNAGGQAIVGVVQNKVGGGGK